MPETQNLNSYYTTNAKVEMPKMVAVAPQSLPSRHVFNDIDANRKMKALNNDIYEGTKEQKNKSKKTFWKVFGGIVLAIIGYRWIKSFFK